MAANANNADNQDFALSFRRALSRQLLAEAGRQQLTLGRLAKKAEVPLSTLNNVLGGISPNPGVLTLLTICEGLGLKLEEVIAAAREEAQGEAPAGA